MQNQIPNNWEKVKLGTIADINMGQSPSSKFYNLNGDGLPFYQGVTDFGEKYPNPSMYCSQPAKTAEPGTVLFSVRAPVGEINIANEEICIGRGVASLSMKNGNNEFLYQLLKSQVGYFKAVSCGTTYESINKDQIEDIEVVVPVYLEDQKRVASVLSAFDDKIEINNKIAKTLEEMVQTIFKEWFVKFQFPGYKKVEFIDSDLGKIPEGWKISTLKDIVDLKNNRYAKNNIKDRIPYLPIDLIQSKTLLLKETAPVEDAKSSLIKFFENDILFGAMRPYFFKVSIAPFMGLSRTTCFVFRPKTRDLFGYASFVFFRQKTIDYATNLSQGSTIPYAKWSGALAEMQILEPSLELLQLFNAISLPVIEKIKNIYFENEKLSSLRDLLLPKLMRGEIRV